MSLTVLSPQPLLSDRIIEQIKRDPPQAAYDLFRFECKGPKQEEILCSVFLHRLIEIHSGQGVGKTESLGVLPFLWLYSHPYGYWIQTAATWKPLESKLWPLVEKNYARAVFPIGGRMTQRGLVLAPGWEIVLMSPTDPLVAHGWHSEGGTCFSVDEASDMDQAYYQHIRASVSGDRDALLLTFNPTRTDGPAADAMDSPSFHHIEISSLDSPNVIAGREVVPGLCSAQFIQDIIDDYGIDSYEYTVRVLGKKPTDDQMTVISRYMIEQAIALFQAAMGQGSKIDVLNVSGQGLNDLNAVNRNVTDELGRKNRGKLVLGIDTGLSTAGDPTVWIGRDDLSTVCDFELASDDPQRLLSESIRIIRNDGPFDEIFIDAQGAPYLPGQLQALGYPVHAIRFGSEAHNPAVYVDQRAEMHYRLRDWLRQRGGAIEPKLGRKLMWQAGIQRLPTSDGRNRIEPKDKIKERIGRSTDHMDALALTCVEMPGEIALPHATDNMQMQARPSVFEQEEGGRKVYHLELEGMPRIIGTTPTTQPGYLMRSWWVVEPMACLWYHVDRLGSWCIIDAVQQEPYETVEDFAARCLELSRVGGKFHRYRHDWGSGDGHETELINLGDVMLRLARRRGWSGSVPMPSWVEREKLKGNGGMALIGKLTAGSNEGRGQGLYVWPVDVTRAVMAAVQMAGAGSSEIPGKVIGGSYVKALRVCAVEWSPVTQHDFRTSTAQSPESERRYFLPSK